MTALSLRLPDDLVEQTNRLARQLHQTKTDYIRKALERFNQFNEQQLFEQSLIASVQEVRPQTLITLDDWHDVSGDGLRD
jgi:predicted transcriptional regulator